MRASPRRRERPIRVLLASIFIVPLASLVGLWGFAASVTASNAIQEHNFNSEDNLFGGWAQKVFSALANERAQAFIYLSTGRHMSSAPYVAAQREADSAVRGFQKGLNASFLAFTSAARPALYKFQTELAWLNGGSPGYPGIRPQVTAGTVSPLGAFEDYDTVIDSEFNLYAKLVQVSNTRLYLQAEGSVEAGRAVELASREATLVIGASYAGRMTQAERVLFTQMAGERQLLMNQALDEMQPSLDSGYVRAENSRACKNFMMLENLVINGIGPKGRLPVTLTPLLVSADTLPLFALYQTAQVQDRLAVSNLGTSIGNRLLAEVGLAGGLGLLAVALSVFLMIWFGRRISRDLTGLQRAALNLAEERLPRVVARLGAGEDVDVAAEAAPIAAGRIAETARVAEAFSSVQRTAVEAAVGQARLRRGVSQVFKNLAWRSQSLLHRQLALLDTMERKQTEPETLDQLFQLDHLTTRMRRHAEGLLILSDAPPGRGWRDPVPIIDVVRAAIAEVEDYKRVNVLCDADDSVVGSAVADVIHLLAELIENAAVYSPNTTEVTVRGERVANGFVVEVEDRGIGISAVDLEAFNDRLANPPEFDLADSNQLGLFVVARLAVKHRIMITLRRSPYGGTAAIVLIPHSIVVVGSASIQRSEMPGTEILATALSRTALQAGAATMLRPLADQAVTLAREDPGEPILGFPAVRAAAMRAAAVGTENGGNGAPPNGASAGFVATAENGGNGAPPNGPPAGFMATAENGANGALANATTAEFTATAENGSPGPAASGAGENGEGPPPSPPWLPKRRRQENLAPELKTDRLADDETERPDADGPSPAGTRALVESLQYGLDRARMTPAEDSWPEVQPETLSWPGQGDFDRGSERTERPEVP